MVRKLFLYVAALFLCTSLQAQEQFFSSIPGNTLKWAIYEGEKQTLFGYCEETLVSMNGDSQNAHVKYSYSFYDQKGKSVIGKDPFEFQVDIVDGKVTAHVSDMFKAIKSGDYMYVGDISTIPADIEVGTKLKDSEIKAKLLDIFDTKNEFKNRSVTDKCEIEVPAGKFDCYLIEDEEYFSGKGPFGVKTWVSRGVGIVRQEIRNKKGEITQIYVLESK